jgi:hypothetical protein
MDNKAKLVQQTYILAIIQASNCNRSQGKGNGCIIDSHMCLCVVVCLSLSPYQASKLVQLERLTYLNKAKFQMLAVVNNKQVESNSNSCCDVK